ncbi:MAG: LamG-like jellyroll fold domain-containing protein [bacterium]
MKTHSKFFGVMIVAQLFVYNFTAAQSPITVTLQPNKHTWVTPQNSAAIVNLPLGTYNVTASFSGTHAGGDIDRVFFFAGTGETTSQWPRGHALYEVFTTQTKTITFPSPAGISYAQGYLFFVDAGDLNDNSGTATVTFIKVPATTKADTIITTLQPNKHTWITPQNSAAIVNLPLGAYNVTASFNGTHAGGDIDRVFFFAGTGETTSQWPRGHALYEVFTTQTKTITFPSPAGISYAQGYLFFVDAGDLGDNTGTATVTFNRVSDGLVAYYPFNGNVNDESGNGNNGTLAGATLTTDRLGNSNKAYSFNGSSYIQIPHNAILQYPTQLTMTISGWATLSSYVDNAAIVSKGTSHYSYQLQQYNQRIAFSYQNNTRVGNKVLLLNKWVLFTAVISGRNLKLYLDNELDSEFMMEADPTNDTEPMNIGRSLGGQYWKGSLDDIRIYNRALSLSEIQLILTDVKHRIDETLPREIILSQNYPNPFNPSTIIEYQLPQIGTVEIRIYNSVGQLIRSLLNEQRDAGSYSVRWDGRDNTGRQVASGTYFYQIKAVNYIEAKKMLLLR